MSGGNTLTTPHLQSIDMALASDSPCPTANTTPSSSGWKRSTFSTIRRGVRRTETFWLVTTFPGAPANAAHQGFGVISTTALPMRQIQLGLKYYF